MSLALLPTELSETLRFPLCGHVEHDTAHMFECSEIVITKRPVIMWLNSVSVVDLVTEFRPSKNKSKVLPSGRHLM